MPRDLSPPSPPPPPMVASPESQNFGQDGPESMPSQEQEYKEFTIHRDETNLVQQLRGRRAKADERNDLHPYVQTLSISNLESCLALEDAIFPPHERCSRDKFVYRLTVCPEQCLGLFSTITSPPDPSSVPTYSAARPADSSQLHRKQTLIAMIIAVKTVSTYVSDASMDLPPDYATQSRSPDDRRGHFEDGRTICIHSFGVLPAYQKRGLGKMLMTSYQQRMETSGVADRIALLSHEPLVNMYAEMKFENRGQSEVKFGDGGWINLVYEFEEHLPGS